MASKASAYFSCHSAWAKKFRKSSQVLGESAEQAYPSTPPIIAVGSPAPPSVAGSGNQPRSASG
jgi:hypothetical protein